LESRQLQSGSNNWRKKKSRIHVEIFLICCQIGEGKFFGRDGGDVVERNMKVGIREDLNCNKCR
jgi:hypothetical protein